MPRGVAIEVPAPMAELNTTPLIDVMLVLLVMFIITLPLQTHAVKLDLPNGVPPHFVPPNPVANEVAITQSGAILWNGTPISQATLRQELRLTQQMDPVPELRLRPDPRTRYQVVDEVLATIKREHVTKVGFVGNERFSVM
jgi:biopolymer transport protein ExbD